MLAQRCRPSGYMDVSAFMTHRDYYGITERMVRSWVDASHTSEDFMRCVHGHVRARLARPVFIEKSPTNVYNFARFAERMPDVPLVHMVRDGRDVVASLRRRGFNLFAAGSRWLYDVSSGLRARQAPSYLEVRYEDLVSQPSATLARIFEHVGVDPAVDVLHATPQTDRGTYSEDWLARKEPRVWRNTPADPISAASVGSYKESLSEAELALLYRIRLTARVARQMGSEAMDFGELLQSLGYQGTPEAERAHLAWLDEVLLQLKEYNRRLSRFHHNRQWMLPRRYTRFGA